MCGSGGEDSDYSDDPVQVQPSSSSSTPKKGRDVFLEEEPIVFEVNGVTVTGKTSIVLLLNIFKIDDFKNTSVDTTWATAQTSLARYLRTYLGLTGTKIMCAQAGCGACVVTASHTNPATGEEMIHSVNSVKQCFPGYICM